MALPEEITVIILSWLPVKSLIRFTCVSKRFRSIILSDPNFAKSQFHAAHDRKILHHRLLCARLLCSFTPGLPLFKSLDLETPSFGHHSSVRELKFPSPSPTTSISLLGSCNGIVFLAFSKKVFCVWNPSTGFFKELPDPGLLYDENHSFRYGVGYLSATDEYKLFIRSAQYSVFSSRAQTWKRLEVFPESCPFSIRGTLLNEALHWISHGNGVMAFDLAQEKFRKMTLPDYYDEYNINQCADLGVTAEGCLSFAFSTGHASDCICVWVMKEYGVLDSWTKLFSFKFLCPPKDQWGFGSVVVLGTSIAAHIYNVIEDEDYGTSYADGTGWIKILHKEEDKRGMYWIEGSNINMIQYQESLLRLDD
ncbi:PREDICTED: F-box protein CPR30-like isoform X1 [Fragaria vesca subsp. vesca]|uniref:F-box protein CPR30-like isoform X1 n=1 Tax=Fragaria vesca subsp. vesca TaxID=101020 RepID=UPI0002C31488|nr:PREDICTED: F-box protein CPR30-like isoform X1 [Fragaria vesca subsp. vesca]